MEKEIKRRINYNKTEIFGTIMEAKAKKGMEEQIKSKENRQEKLNLGAQN